MKLVAKSMMRREQLESDTINWGMVFLWQGPGYFVYFVALERLDELSLAWPVTRKPG